MNIAFIGSFSGIGGIQRVSALLASELSKNNNVHFIDYRCDDDFYFNLDKNIIIHKIASINNKGRKILHGENIYNIYSKEIENIQFIIKNNNVDIAIYCGSFCTALINYIKHELPNIKAIAWQHNNYEQYTGKYIEKYRDDYLSSIKIADYTVSLTNYDAENFSKLNKNSICIYNPVKIDNMEKCNLENKCILFAGRIDIEHKGLDLLLHAFDKFEDENWRLTIVGEGDLDSLTSIIKKLKKRELITRKNNLYGDQLYNYYLNSSIFILTSRWEGFPMVLLEAMSFGLPIISTPITCAKELFKNNEYGIICNSFSINDIIESIVLLTNSIEKRELYSHQSLKRVRDFNIIKILPLWNKLLFELFGNN